jgi:hypothetical protein
MTPGNAFTIKKLAGHSSMTVFSVAFHPALFPVDPDFSPATDAESQKHWNG